MSIAVLIQQASRVLNIAMRVQQVLGVCEHSCNDSTGLKGSEHCLLLQQVLRACEHIASNSLQMLLIFKYRNAAYTRKYHFSFILCSNVYITKLFNASLIRSILPNLTLLKS